MSYIRGGISILTNEEIRQRKLISKYLVGCYHSMKKRCENPGASGFKYYGGRGIKCLLSYSNLLDLWERDRGYKLKRPSIDRIDSNGHYTMKNCRFIELSENSRRAHLGKRHRQKIVI